MKFLTERTKDGMLFPRPTDNTIIRISPPGLSCLPAEGAFGYRVEIQDEEGKTLYSKTTGSDPVHLPDRVLPPGKYIWDVAGLDDQGNEVRSDLKQLLPHTSTSMSCL